MSKKQFINKLFEEINSQTKVELCSLSGTEVFWEGVNGRSRGTIINERDGLIIIQKEKYAWPRLRDLPKEERESFFKWLTGQTLPMVDGVPLEEQDFYFPWDYKRWKEGLPVID